MADFLLIHGSCHGAWCWRDLIPEIYAHGHTVRALDLPGHGRDTTPLSQVTLESYAQAIANACTKDTVLVGHSMGGYAIGAAACLVPEKISKLVYLCAYVPQDGVSLAEMRMQAPYQPLLPAIRMRPDGISFIIDPKMAAEVFYNDCSDAVAEQAIAQLCPQATAPTNIPFRSTPQMRALPQHYIRCMDDRAIPPEFQVTMTKSWPNADVQEMACGHSPFLAAPKELAKRLIQAAQG